MSGQAPLAAVCPEVCPPALSAAVLRAVLRAVEEKELARPAAEVRHRRILSPTGAVWQAPWKEMANFTKNSKDR